MTSFVRLPPLEVHRLADGTLEAELAVAVAVDGCVFVVGDCCVAMVVGFVLEAFVVVMWRRRRQSAEVQTVGVAVG